MWLALKLHHQAPAQDFDIADAINLNKVNKIIYIEEIKFRGMTYRVVQGSKETDSSDMIR